MNSSQELSQTTLCDEEKFKDLSDIDSEVGLSLIWHQTRSRLFRVIFVLLSAFAVLVAIIYFVVVVSDAKGNSGYDQCGTTADEARARGCVFETTGFTWLPKECHDKDTEEEFLSFIQKHEINLYRDTNYTDVVSIEEIRLGNGPGCESCPTLIYTFLLLTIAVFVRQQYHVTHCQFLLKKLHRLSASGRMVDGQIMPTHHTEHCIEQTLQLAQNPSWRKEAIQLSYTKFPYCGKVGGYNVGWDQQHGKPTGWTDH